MSLIGRKPFYKQITSRNDPAFACASVLFEKLPVLSKLMDNPGLTMTLPPNTFKNMIVIRRSYLLLVSALIPALNCGQALANGDTEYGEYLSSECTTCHQPKAADTTIPSLDGMDEGGFVQIMKLYRDKKLENPTMRTVAGRLTDEDIAALAAYYSALPTPD